MGINAGNPDEINQGQTDSETGFFLPMNELDQYPTENLRFLLEQKHPSVDLTKNPRRPIVLRAARMKFTKRMAQKLNSDREAVKGY
jgi:hypothetical protein